MSKDAFHVWYSAAYEAWVVEPHVYPQGVPVSPFPLCFRPKGWAEEVCALLNRLAALAAATERIEALERDLASAENAYREAGER